MLNLRWPHQLWRLAQDAQETTPAKKPRESAG
jgi:hypothetical protein